MTYATRDEGLQGRDYFVLTGDKPETTAFYNLVYFVYNQSDHLLAGSETVVSRGVKVASSAHRKNIQTDTT